LLGHEPRQFPLGCALSTPEEKAALLGSATIVATDVHA
jgi:hypothetical protein